MSMRPIPIVDLDILEILVSQSQGREMSLDIKCVSGTSAERPDIHPSFFDEIHPASRLTLSASNDARLTMDPWLRQQADLSLRKMGPD